MYEIFTDPSNFQLVRLSLNILNQRLSDILSTILTTCVINIYPIKQRQPKNFVTAAWT